jgi:hypothetical protein
VFLTMAERKQRERRYTAQLVILEEPTVAGEVRYWAEVRDGERTGQNLAPTLREIVRAGLEALRPAWEKNYGPPPAGALELFAESAIK